MKYRAKTHPTREASLCKVELVSHKAVRLKFAYHIESKGIRTTHWQTFDIGLCQAQHLGYRLHSIYADLKVQLDDFRRAISGQ